MGLLDDPFSMMMLGGFGGMGGGAAPMAAGNPFGQAQGGSSLARNLMQMRAMRYAREPMARVGRMPAQSRGPQFTNMEAEGPGYSQFTFDPAAHAAASKYLSQFGLSPLDPQQVQRNTILPNSGFFGAHPRLSGALEGGIYSASQVRGADTWGEGIQSVAQSLIGGPMAKRAAWEQQFARPFNAARMLEGMQDLTQKRDLQEAEIQHYRAVTESLKNKPARQAITPIPSTASSYATYDDRGQPTLHENPYFDPKQAKAAAANTPGVAPYVSFFHARGVEPTEATPKQWQQAIKDKKAFDIAVSGGRAATDTWNRIHENFASGKDVPVQIKDQLEENKRAYLNPKDEKVRESILFQIIDPKNPHFDPKVNPEQQIDEEIARRNQATLANSQKIISDYQKSLKDQPYKGKVLREGVDF